MFDSPRLTFLFEVLECCEDEDADGDFGGVTLVFCDEITFDLGEDCVRIVFGFCLGLEISEVFLLVTLLVTFGLTNESNLVVWPLLEREDIREDVDSFEF